MIGATPITVTHDLDDAVATIQVRTILAHDPNVRCLLVGSGVWGEFGRVCAALERAIEGARAT